MERGTLGSARTQVFTKSVDAKQPVQQANEVKNQWETGSGLSKCNKNDKQKEGGFDLAKMQLWPLLFIAWHCLVLILVVPCAPMLLCCSCSPSRGGQYHRLYMYAPIRNGWVPALQ